MTGFWRRWLKVDVPLEDRTEEILRRHLDHDFVTYPLAESAGSREDLKRIAKRWGVMFPLEFVAHVCGRFPGMFVEVREEVWPRPKLYEVAPFWSFLYGLHTFTPCPNSEDWMRLDFVTPAFQERTGLQCAPILKIVDDDDVYVVDESGAIARYRHETNDLTPETRDFWIVLEREITELKNRKIRKLAEK